MSHFPKRSSATAIIAGLLPQASETICRILPSCDAGTISDEIAERLGTTPQGAHLWLLSPFLGPLSPLRPVAEQIAVDELVESQRLGTLSKTLSAPHVSTPRIRRVAKRLERTVTPRTRSIFARERRRAVGLISRRSSRIIDALNALEVS